MRKLRVEGHKFKFGRYVLLFGGGSSKSGDLRV